MKAFRALLIVAAVCGMSFSAFADPIDFKMNVLDPPTSFPVNVITSDTFTVSFISCQGFALPAGVTADGCFAGSNASPDAWTSLDLSFIGNASTAGQVPDCSPASAGNIFQQSSCSLVDGTFLLGYDDGTIPNNDGVQSIFFITETGVIPATDFPTGTVVANLADTPEPGSILLLLTGTIFFSYLSLQKFRHTTLS
jgi:hypothetical protein